jgi:hypothetical protein
MHVLQEGLSPTQLFSRNMDVDNHNHAELAELPGNLFRLQAVDGVSKRTRGVRGRPYM